MVNIDLVAACRVTKSGPDLIIVTDLGQIGSVVNSLVLYTEKEPIGGIIVTNLLNGGRSSLASLLDSSGVVVTSRVYVCIIIILPKGRPRRKDECEGKDARDLEKLSHGCRCDCV